VGAKCVGVLCNLSAGSKARGRGEHLLDEKRELSAALSVGCRRSVWRVGGEGVGHSAAI